MTEPALRRDVSLRPYTSLRAGGSAELFAECSDVDSLAEAAIYAHSLHDPVTILGSGSNVLPADAGVSGLVILNRARHISLSEDGEVIADTGCAFQDLFLKAAQHRLAGLSYAVGIPGTLGGALVSNAGAYRSCVSDYLTRLEVVYEGERKWVEPAWMEFSYRDSVLRRPNPPRAVMLRVSMKLPFGEPKQIYDGAREFQRQRISKQPPSPSAGSFFKNVISKPLAESLSGLPDSLKKAGIVPAGYLIEAAGLKGFRKGGAMFGKLHANFILNVGNASATDIRRLACMGKRIVLEQFHVELEEEVLYIGNWDGFFAS